MSVIGFSEEEIQQVLEVTALVLKLGNVELTGEFQANGIPASGIRDGRGLWHSAGTPLLVSFEYCFYTNSSVINFTLMHAHLAHS
jgi:hypothetical protein